MLRGSALDALSTVVNKSELLWFYRKGSPAGTKWKPGSGVRLLHKWQEPQCSLTCSLLYTAKQSGQRASYQGGKDRREWMVALGEIPSLPTSLTDLRAQEAARETLSRFLFCLPSWWWLRIGFSIAGTWGANWRYIYDTDSFRCSLIY